MNDLQLFYLLYRTLAQQGLSELRNVQQMLLRVHRIQRRIQYWSLDASSWNFCLQAREILFELHLDGIFDLTDIQSLIYHKQAGHLPSSPLKRISWEPKRWNGQMWSATIFMSWLDDACEWGKVTFVNSSEESNWTKTFWVIVHKYFTLCRQRAADRRILH